MSESAPREVAVLNAALELPPGERGAYLDAACAGDPELRRQIESLLRAHEAAGDFLTALPDGVGLGQRPPVDSCAARAGDRVGRYKLLQEIGEGGCGVVYMAEQEEPVRRRVALKILKLGMDTKQVIARFEAERQALAVMDHPNIARVFDAGATETGRPYFVMELVRGTRITEFCDQNGVATEDRLKLFIQVCQAIQHAHQKGIIHRDIKPSNILVTVNDGVPVPKVIDFGIAKATQGRLTERTLFTRFEQFIGTPAYMSPEQAVMTSLDVDTRSDIYSLGVLLYELLTGRTPFDQKELLAAGFDEMRRTIREVEPVKPSTRLTQELARPAFARSAAARDLIRQLRGELDWIVMKCLEKDRARRYETANSLASEVQRYLQREPITARPPSRVYRLRKLVQRHRFTFAAAGLVAAALVAVAVGSALAAWRVAEARRAEQTQRRTAEAANRELRETVQLLELERAEDFFAAHDAALGVAHLSAILRRDPWNAVAANRLWSALTQRGWAVPGAATWHVAPVTLASFSPDGRAVLNASRDRSARVWDAASGRALFAVAHPDALVSAGYSPDGRRLITASADGLVQICDAATGAVQSRWRHRGELNWAELSQDGTLAVTAGADHVARLWDPATGALKRELRGHSRPIRIACLSPDGKLVATGTDWGGLRLWQAESGKLAFRLGGHQDLTPVETLAFSPDGRRLVSGGYDHTVRFWNVATGEPLGAPLVHRLRVWHLEFSPDGKLLIATCEDGVARFWDVETLRPLGEPLRHESGVIFARFSPDGGRVVTTSSDNTARVWDVRTQAPLCQPLRHIRRVLHANFSPDGRRLVTASADGVAQIWDLRPPLEPGVQVRHDRKVAPLALTSDGAGLLTAGHDRTLRLWDPRTGQPLSEPARPESSVAAADLAPDGRRAAVAFTDHTVWVWDFGAGNAAPGTLTVPRAVAGPMEHEQRIRSVRFNADGSRVVTASIDGMARVWDVAGGRLITAALVHRAAVTAANFSPDGRRVVTASDDFTAQVWDAQTGQPRGAPLAHFDQVKWAEFSPDGEKVLTTSTDNSACLWEARTGRKLLTLQHARIVDHGAFSPDGRRVATASLDRTAQVWDAETGQALTPPLRHDLPVSQVHFSADGRRLFTAVWSAANAPARLWDADTGRPLTEWLKVEDSWGNACFDPAGGRVILGATNGIARVWRAPEVTLPVPAWFPEFAEAVAGVRLTDRGAIGLAPRQLLSDFGKGNRASAAGNDYERIAQRFR